MTATFIFYVIFAALSVILPIIATGKLRKRFNGEIKNFKYGIVVYILFSVVLSNLVLKAVGKTSLLIEVIVNTLCIGIGLLIWLKFVAKKSEGVGDCLLFGTGFGTGLIIFRYFIAAVESAVISFIAVIGKDLTAHKIYGGIAQRVQENDPYTVFLNMLEMVFFAVLSISVAVIFYQVILCNAKKRWIGLGVLLNALGYILVAGENLKLYKKLTDLSMDTKKLFVFLLLITAIIGAGAAYSLVFPYKKKENKE